MTDAGRRLGLKGVSFGGPLQILHLNPHSPARRHCWLLHWREEVGFLEVSVPLDSYGGGIGFAQHFAWLPAPTRSCWIPPPRDAVFHHGNKNALSCISPWSVTWQEEIPAGGFKTPVSLGGQRSLRSADQVNLARRLLGGVQICPPGRGPQIIYGNLFYPQISANLKGLEKSFWISPSFRQRRRDTSSSRSHVCF